MPKTDKTLTPIYKTFHYLKTRHQNPLTRDEMQSGLLDKPASLKPLIDPITVDDSKKAADQSLLL